MSTICTICARGGSRGVPGKNVRPLLGKPLIVHTIELALAHPRLDGVFVSTDSEEIAQIARGAGAIVPYLRPAELATDAAGKLPAIQHLVEHVEAGGLEVGRIVDLDPTSPLRLPLDVDACLDLVDAGAEAVITVFEAEKNPYFNMVELDETGVARVSKQSSTGPVVARQFAPPVYSINGSIYIWRRHSLGGVLWDSKLRLYIMPRERSIDIDSELDFKLVELLMREKLEK